MSPGTETTIRHGTRVAAVGALLGGAVLLVLELQDAAPRPALLVLAAALVASGPLFWVLARAPLAVIGATAAFALGSATVAQGLIREGWDAGFDLGLGLCLCAVAVWTLWGHFRPGSS